MFYANANMAYTPVRRAEDYVYRNWVDSNQASLFEKHILSRGAYLLLTPASLITSALDTIIGLGTGIGAICTLGKDRSTNRMAFDYLSSSNELVVRPYLNFLRTINPKAKLSVDSSELSLFKWAANSSDGDGFISRLVADRLIVKATVYSTSHHFLKRHVASRLTYALLTIARLVTRAVDGVIGLPVASLSLLTGGKFRTLNYLSYRMLEASGIIDDLFYCTIRFINPQAEFC